MKRLVLLLAFTLFSFGAAGAQNYEWRLMNSQITAFAQLPGSPNTVFAGDVAGLIRRSDDKGATWELASMQSEAQIRDIAFLNATTGFATTNEWGLVLKTTDGGKTWARLQLAENNNGQIQPVRNTHRIVVVDEQTAFFDIFNHPISAPSGKVGVVTRDGGLTFKSDTTPGEVYHVSGSTLMAFGREVAQFGLSKFTIYKSTDKGLTWNILKTSPAGLGSTFDNNGIGQGFFLSENEFFLTANKNIGNDDNIYKTTDGGLNFTALSNYPGVDADFLYFKNANEGLVIAGNGVRTTYTTSDGGATWAEADKHMYFAGKYLGNNEVIAAIADHTALSTDFGKTWTEQADALRQQKNGSLNYVQVINDSTAAASLGGLSQGTYFGRELMLTRNGGLTWNIIKDGANKPLVGTVFHFVSADTFFYIGAPNSGMGNANIKYTTDGAKTSTDLLELSFMELVQEIVSIDKNNLVTWAENTSIMNQSSDGGKTWAQIMPQQHLPGTTTRAIFPHINLCYKFTSTNQVFKSTDQGKNWTDVTSESIFGLMHFINPTTGYAFNSQKKLLKTTDGGATWANMESEFDSKIAANQNTLMVFKNDNTGYLMDGNSNSFNAFSYTTDGGKTWAPYKASQIGNWIVKMAFSGENSGVMLDRTGGFARYVGPQNFTTDTVFLNAPAVSVTEFLKENAFTIYPNPANDFVVLKSGEEGIQSVEISNVMGQILLKQDVTNAENLLKISTENLANGTYFVKITTARGVVLKGLNIVR